MWSSRFPRAEVDRYLRKAFDDLVPEAQIPGFRSGRAPRKLVEKQFKKKPFTSALKAAW